MYCPQCGTESTAGQQYCRSCGANLKVIGKALTLSEAIARSDRGPLPKLKELVKNLKVDQVTEEVSRALERMNSEIVRTTSKAQEKKGKWPGRRKKTPEERREERLTKGIVKMFSGAGVMVFLYYISAVLVLRLPPDALANIPFELEPVVRVLWLLGLIPVLSGAGSIAAGLLIRPARPVASLEGPPETPPQIDSPASAPTETTSADSTRQGVPLSVTERTTNLLEKT